jgi:hypothetical protein
MLLEFRTTPSMQLHCLRPHAPDSSILGQALASTILRKSYGACIYVLVFASNFGHLHGEYLNQPLVCVASELKRRYCRLWLMLIQAWIHTFYAKKAVQI